MNIRELIELLEDVDPDAEVLLAHQPSWPLQFTVAGIYDAANADQPCDEHDNYDCEECETPTPNTAVYIVEGDHPDSTPYAPRDASANVIEC
jgi:hypothetical protein